MNASMEELRGALKDCVSAMRRSQDEGCTDHLDSTDDAGQFWYGAIEKAEELLKS